MHRNVMRRFVFGLLAAAVVSCLVSNQVEAADIVIEKGGDTGMIVVADAEWIAPEEWRAMPDKKRRISSWRAPEEMPYQAAVLLRDTLGKVTGAELEIVRETDWEKQKRPPAIHVGRTRRIRRALGKRIERPNLERNGFVIQSRPDLLMICGVNDYGTYNGAGRFLERWCGVDWFWPGSIGEEVAERDRIELERLNTTFTPAVVFMSGNLRSWGARIGEGTVALPKASHSMAPEYFHPGREVRPEWFSLIGDERLIPGPRERYFTWQPCMAGPAPLRRLVSLTKHKLRQKPDRLGVGIGYNDGVWQPCECRFCRAADTGYDPSWDTYPFMSNGGRASSRYFQMISHLATAIQEEFPGKLVSGWSYAGTDIPPAGLPPNPNLTMTVIGTKLAWLNPKLQAWEEKRIQRWGRLVGRLLTYDYFYQTGFIPVHVPHHYADVVRTLKRLGVRYEYAETYQMMALAGPKYWLHVKLCQDPSQDVDYLLDRWMSGMFHRAAAPMSRYYETIERAWIDYPFHDRHARVWSAYCFARGTDLPVLTPEHVETMAAALKEAEEAAELPRVRRRLAAVRTGFKLTRKRAKTLWKRRPLVDPVPWEMAEIRDDWRGHIENRSFVNPKAYYKKHCLPLEDQHLFSRWHLRKMPENWDDAPSRLSRVVNGLLSLSREATALKTDAPEAARAMLNELLGRSLDIPAAKTPTLDGDFDEACWQELAVHDRLLGEPADWDGAAVSFPAANARTAFRICHDSRAFYLAVDCQAVDAEGKDGIDILLAPLQHTRRALKVTVSPDGEVVENGAGYGSKYWHAGTRAEATTTEDGYRLEIAIPFRALLLGKKENTVMFNLRRKAPAAAWYPLPIGIRFDGGIVCSIEDRETERLVPLEGWSPMKALNSSVVERKVTAGAFMHYVIERPAGVDWQDGGPVLTGGAAVLVGEETIDILRGTSLDIEVEYEGEGNCIPRVGFYRRSADDYLDVLDGFRFSKVETSNREGRTIARVQADWPAKARRPQGFADAARLRVRVEGDASVHAIRLIPCPQLEISLQMNSGGEPLRTGHVLTLLATITNRSEVPIENLDVDISSVDGVDRRACGLSPASTLAPGESTRTLWWYVPTYAVGKARFNVVVNADGHPPVVHRMHGPELQ